jgi:hypothetical protein
VAQEETHESPLDLSQEAVVVSTDGSIEATPSSAMIDPAGINASFELPVVEPSHEKDSQDALSKPDVSSLEATFDTSETKEVPQPRHHAVPTLHLLVQSGPPSKIPVADSTMWHDTEISECAVQDEEGSCLVYATSSSGGEEEDEYDDDDDDDHDDDDEEEDDDDEEDEIDYDDEDNPHDDYLGKPPHLCADVHEQCPTWAAEGECESNPNIMDEQCPFSCHSCPSVPYHYLTLYGEPQSVSEDRMEELEALLEQIDRYMYETVFVDPSYEKVKDEVR